MLCRQHQRTPYFDRRKQKSQIANAVLLGQSGSGKSTVAGHLLFQLGQITENKLMRLEAKGGKKGSSTKFAQVFDSQARKRLREGSCQVTMSMLYTEMRQCIVLDSSGHRDYIAHTIRAMSMGDFGIVVISAAKGQFQQSWAKDGTVRDHMILGYALGLKELIVVVNKMDHTSVEYSQERYNEIKKEVSEVLQKIGYKPERTPFIPVSGFNGENLTAISPNMKWYQGHVLIQAIKQARLPMRHIRKTFRMTIHKRYQREGKGFVVVGKIISGRVRTGAMMYSAPLDQYVETVQLKFNGQHVEQAEAGQIVGVNVVNTQPDALKLGYVLGTAVEPHKGKVIAFDAQIIVVKNQSKNSIKVVLMDHGRVVAAGVVKKVEIKEENA